MKRLKGTGLLARGLSCAAFLVISISVAAYWATGGRDEWMFAVVFQLFVSAVLVRSLFVGVYVSKAGVRLSTWWRSYKLDWQDLRRSDAIPYDGLMSKGIETRLACMIQVTLSDGRMLALPSTIGRPKTVMRQAASLNWLIQKALAGA